MIIISQFELCMLYPCLPWFGLLSFGCIPGSFDVLCSIFRLISFLPCLKGSFWLSSAFSSCLSLLKATLAYFFSFLLLLQLQLQTKPRKLVFRGSPLFATSCSSTKDCRWSRVKVKDFWKSGGFEIRFISSSKLQRNQLSKTGHFSLSYYNTVDQNHAGSTNFSQWHALESDGKLTNFVLFGFALILMYSCMACGRRWQKKVAAKKRHENKEKPPAFLPDTCTSDRTMRIGTVCTRSLGWFSFCLARNRWLGKRWFFTTGDCDHRRWECCQQHNAQIVHWRHLRKAPTKILCHVCTCEQCEQ